MAVTTTSALQAAIDTLSGNDVGTVSPVKILQEVHDSATYSRWYVMGNSNRVANPTSIYNDKGLWVKTTVSGNVAAQAAEVLGAMRLDSNVDPDAQV